MDEWTDEELKEYIEWCRVEYFLSELNKENNELNNDKEVISLYEY